jgi:hypothetical protein
MNKSRLAAMFLGAAVAGCGVELEQPKSLTFEEFKAQALHEEDDVYVVSGDTAVQGEDALREMFNEYLKTEVGDIAQRQDELALYRLNGIDQKYDSTRKMNLTYCVSSASFGSRYSAAVSAMANAAAAWEAVAQVNFIHASQYDSNCNQYQTGVYFDVRMTTTTSYVARAFFPNGARSGRNVLISTSGFTMSGPVTLTGVVRHELGHVLGMRHEHTRPEARTCYEDGNWRALTSYDSASVMHYPQCNGSNTGDLRLTQLDINGVRAVYGAKQ